MAVTTVKGHFDVNADGTYPYYSLHRLIRDAAVATGDWELLQPAEPAYAYMLKGKGYSGTDEIYIGFSRENHFDIYDTGNIVVCGFTGFVPENAFSLQPGHVFTRFHTVRDSLDYWINISPQRICGATRQCGGVWQSFYAGFLNRYGLPQQFPYPLLIAAGNNVETFNLVYNFSTILPPYMTGNSTKVYMRDNKGIWLTPYIYPYSNAPMCNVMPYRTRPCNASTGDVFPLLPLIIHDSGGLYGELEGVYAAPGWDVELGDIINTDGIDHLLIGNVVLRDSGYIALRMD
jgi:hypothetical protein